jgi:hypothetical protein
MLLFPITHWILLVTQSYYFHQEKNSACLELSYLIYEIRHYRGKEANCF